MTNQTAYEIRAKISSLEQELATAKAELAAHLSSASASATQPQPEADSAQNPPTNTELPFPLPYYRRYGRQMILEEFGLPGKQAPPRVLTKGLTYGLTHAPFNSFRSIRLRPNKTARCVCTRSGRWRTRLPCAPVPRRCRSWCVFSVNWPCGVLN